MFNIQSGDKQIAVRLFDVLMGDKKPSLTRNYVQEFLMSFYKIFLRISKFGLGYIFKLLNGNSMEFIVVWLLDIFVPVLG